jgi:hypothetical protein
MWYGCSIVVHRFDRPVLAAPTSLAPGVRLEPVPEWVKSDEVLKNLALNDRKAVRKSQVAFTSEYIADALGSPDPDWASSHPRSIQAATEEKFSLASIALWLAYPSPLSGGPVLHFSEAGDPASLRMAGSLKPVLVNKKETNNTPSMQDLTYSGTLLRAIMSLPRTGTIWVAARMLVRAVTEPAWETRYLLLWVTLEALFGSESPQETTYRLSQRLALFLGDDAESCKCYFEKIKEGYGWRSKVVHGSRLAKLTSEKSVEITEVAETIVRKTFTRILEHDDLTKKFDARSREEFLDSLLFEMLQ